MTLDSLKEDLGGESESCSAFQSQCVLCDPMGSVVHGILQAGILEEVAIPFCRGSSQPRDQTQALQVDSLPSRPPGKLQNTGVGSLSPLQQIFPTQESNQPLLYTCNIVNQLHIYFFRFYSIVVYYNIIL